MTPRLDSFLGLSLAGFHRVAYWDWGPVDAERTVVCVHGLTRQGRDFDALAQVLVRAGWRVVCPDLVGRGRSAWLRHPAGYTLLQYGADMNALLARLDVKAVDWIGTSLGGLVGTQDYTELALPGGHVGVFVGGKSQGLFAPGVAEWLAKRE